MHRVALLQHKQKQGVCIGARRYVRQEQPSVLTGTGMVLGLCNAAPVGWHLLDEKPCSLLTQRAGCVSIYTANANFLKS